MILSAMTVEIIERRFRRACVWVLIAAGLSMTGLMHSYEMIPYDTALKLVAGMALCVGVFDHGSAALYCALDFRGRNAHE